MMIIISLSNSLILNFNIKELFKDQDIKDKVKENDKNKNKSSIFCKYLF